ncbi:MAG: hypothetical protein Q7S27_04640 [Nanoarchaeota archaeon]|nr:hypothetical protein [Nanoarchaeota archaeon]
MKSNKQKIKEIFILTIFVLGLLLTLIGRTLYPNDTLFFSGIGIISSAMALSIMETLRKKY